LIKGHNQNDFDHWKDCDICNCNLRMCQYCGRDVAMAGGRSSSGGKYRATCNACIHKYSSQIE